MDEIIVLGKREVFAKMYSITEKEFYDAGMQGLKPEFRFDVRACEYGGEDTLVYDGIKYAVCRTYRKGREYIELYVMRKAGVR